jgi:PHD/YefM family antitoxin component YafN of YafNO toxin-antitoxin module
MRAIVHIDKYIEKIIDIFTGLKYNEDRTKKSKEEAIMQELSVVNIMHSIVPITRFNKGEASRIFEEVESSGTKVVMKNNRPACVLMAPSKYEQLMELLSDYVLREEAESRMRQFDAAKSMSHEEMLQSLGLTEADLDDVDVEIE